MVGAGTVRRDDPELTVRLGEGRDPVRVIVTRRGGLPPEAKVLATAREMRTIVVAERADTAARRLLDGARRGARRDRRRGLRAALRRSPQRGLLDILCEGGPTLAGELLGGGAHRPHAAVRGAARRRARRARPVRGAGRGRHRRRLAAAATWSGGRCATICCSAAAWPRGRS